jgi:hypothetical protein
LRLEIESANVKTQKCHGDKLMDREILATSELAITTPIHEPNAQKMASISDSLSLSTPAKMIHLNQYSCTHKLSGSMTYCTGLPLVVMWDQSTCRLNYVNVKLAKDLRCR